MLAESLIIAGSLTFGTGAAVAVPRVFREADPEARLQLVQQHRLRWLAGQPLFGLGSLIAAIGPGLLAADARNRSEMLAFAIAGSLLTIAAAPWCWTLYSRSVRISEFAHRRMPAWPFRIYILGSICGIASFGIGLLLGRPIWVGVIVLGGDMALLAAYLRLNDLPPFLLYVLLLISALALLFSPR